MAATSTIITSTKPILIIMNNNMKISVFTLLLGVFLVSGTQVQAMPRMWRSICGKVDRIYPDEKIAIIITEDKKKKVMLFTWNKRTRAYRNGTPVDKVEFKEGEQLCLHYRTPLFGERWATKVLLGGSKSPEKTAKPK